MAAYEIAKQLPIPTIVDSTAQVLSDQTQDQQPVDTRSLVRETITVPLIDEDNESAVSEYEQRERLRVGVSN